MIKDTLSAGPTNHLYAPEDFLNDLRFVAVWWLVEIDGIAVELIGIMPAGFAENAFERWVIEDFLVEVAEMRNVIIELYDKID